MRGHSRYIGVLTFALAIGSFAFAQQSAAKTPAHSQAKAKGARHVVSHHRAPAYPPHPVSPPAEVAQGQRLFEGNCSFCHGTDARGGESGPNLLRAQVVLDDKKGELISRIVHHGFPDQGMPKFDLSDQEVATIAAFLHSLPLANRGAPGKLDTLVGIAADGKAYFDHHCTTCHSVTRDLAGIGGKYDPKTLQNLIVSGGAQGFAYGRVEPAPPKIPPTTVTVTLPSGKIVEGKLDQLSAFVVGLTESDGTYRSFARNGAIPKIVVENPLQWHCDMLPKWNDTDIHNLTSYLVTLK
ncbi:MAG TPA: c-type cytochrome [Terriglobia bacterium]|nr:c-type cytochrome [Terriglobia bacterium]